MEYRRLGRTGIAVSVVGFGAGPISGLMVDASQDEQAACVAHALQSGINWFDTAATYGEGRSEESLGAALHAARFPSEAHVASKARLIGDDLHDVPGAIRRSVEASLRRLGVSSLTLLQLHNGITEHRGQIPTSLTIGDVLGPRGVAETFESLRAEGLVRFLGLTGTGTATALRQVVRSGQFDTLQIPYHLANPTAAYRPSSAFAETDYGQVLVDCEQLDLGVFAIRVYAGGALLCRTPSPHTLRTPFFPLDLYERDVRRAEILQTLLPTSMAMAEAAVRFVTGSTAVSCALIGFRHAAEIDAAVEYAARGPLEPDLAGRLVRQVIS